MISKFEKYLFESENEIEEYNWGNKPLYHGTSFLIAKKILKNKEFIQKEGGVNDIGRGVYFHPSMNRTSPWVLLASKKGFGAFLEIYFKRPLRLAINKRGLNQRELMDKKFDGIYDKNGIGQITHQILLFNTPLLGHSQSKLNEELIDWAESKIIKFNPDEHGFLTGYSNKEEKIYY